MSSFVFSTRVTSMSQWRTWLLGVMAVACVSCGSSGDDDGAEAPLEQRYSQPGPAAVAIDRNAGCCDSKGNAFDIYRPADLGSPGTRHALIVWGNGSDGVPEKYDYFLSHIASWGMVVVATHDASTANGRTLLDALDYVSARAAKSSDPFFGRIDLNHVAAVGHSQGAGGAVNALIDSAGRIGNALVISLPSQRFCQGDDCTRIPSGMPSGSSIFFASGELDGLSPPSQTGPTIPPLQSLQAYYDAVPAGIVKVKGSVVGSDHNDVQGQPGCAPLALGCRRGVLGFLGYPTAWLAWRLQGASEGPAIFRASGGEMMGNTARWVAPASNVP